MEKFMSGFIMGGLFAAAAALYIINDRQLDRKIYKRSKKAMDMASDFYNDMKF